MKITMTETRAGSRNGIATEAFQAGQEYDLTRTPGERDLAQAFVAARWAKPAAIPAESAEAATAKSLGPAPANRARRGPPENKGA